MALGPTALNLSVRWATAPFALWHRGPRHQTHGAGSRPERRGRFNFC